MWVSTCSTLMCEVSRRLESEGCPQPHSYKQFDFKVFLLLDWLPYYFTLNWKRNSIPFLWYHRYMICKHPHPGFELGLLDLFSTTITIIPRVTPRVTDNEFLSLWTFQPMNFSAYELFSLWIFQPMNISAHEFFSLWTFQPILVNIQTDIHLLLFIDGLLYPKKNSYETHYLRGQLFLLCQIFFLNTIHYKLNISGWGVFYYTP